MLANRPLIMSDGTFRYAPEHFVQMYSIHGYCNKHHLPLVHVFLENKKGDTYTVMWKYLTELTWQHGGMFLHPTRILMDFETCAHGSTANPSGGTGPHLEVSTKMSQTSKRRPLLSHTCKCGTRRVPHFQVWDTLSPTLGSVGQTTVSHTWKCGTRRVPHLEVWDKSGRRLEVWDILVDTSKCGPVPHLDLQCSSWREGVNLPRVKNP